MYYYHMAISLSIKVPLMVVGITKMSNRMYSSLITHIQDAIMITIKWRLENSTITITVFDLISEHTLISGHPPFCAGGYYCQST